MAVEISSASGRRSAAGPPPSSESPTAAARRRLLCSRAIVRVYLSPSNSFDDFWQNGFSAAIRVEHTQNAAAAGGGDAEEDRASAERRDQFRDPFECFALLHFPCSPSLLPVFLLV